MSYSEIRIIIDGLAHVPMLIFTSNFIKRKFVVKTKKAKEIGVKEELIKRIETKM